MINIELRVMPVYHVNIAIYTNLFVDRRQSVRSCLFEPPFLESLSSKLYSDSLPFGEGKLKT